MIKNIIKTILVINVISSYAIPITCPKSEQIAACVTCDYTLRTDCPGLTTTGIEISPTNYDHGAINSSYDFLKASIELKENDDGLSSRDTDNDVTILNCFYLDNATKIEHSFQFDYSTTMNFFLKNCKFRDKAQTDRVCHGPSVEDCILDCESIAPMLNSVVSGPSLFKTPSPTSTAPKALVSSPLTSPTRERREITPPVDLSEEPLIQSGFPSPPTLTPFPPSQSVSLSSSSSSGVELPGLPQPSVTLSLGGSGSLEASLINGGLITEISNSMTPSQRSEFINGGELVCGSARVNAMLSRMNSSEKKRFLTWVRQKVKAISKRQGAESLESHPISSPLPTSFPPSQLVSLSSASLPGISPSVPPSFSFSPVARSPAPAVPEALTKTMITKLTRFIDDEDLKTSYAKVTENMKSLISNLPADVQERINQKGQHEVGDYTKVFDAIDEAMSQLVRLEKILEQPEEEKFKKEVLPESFSKEFFQTLLARMNDRVSKLSTIYSQQEKESSEPSSASRKRKAAKQKPRNK